MKHRYQYSLRSLLVAVTLVAVFCSLLISLTPYAFFLIVAATIPAAIAGRYTGQHPIAYFVGTVFAVRWTFVPLLFALATSEDYPLATLFVVTIASVLGGVQGGKACAEVDWTPLPSLPKGVEKHILSPPADSTNFAGASPQRESTTLGDDEFWTPSRIISAVVVAAYTICAYAFRGGEAALRLLLFCGLPLACIWFPEFMGSYRGTGCTWPRGITTPSPPIVVFILGWVVLASPVVAMLLSCLCR